MCTCNVQELYCSDVYPLLVKNTDKTRGVPVDLVFRDQATLCTGDGEFDDLFVSRHKQQKIIQGIASYSYTCCCAV